MSKVKVTFGFPNEAREDIETRKLKLVIGDSEPQFFSLDDMDNQYSVVVPYDTPCSVELVDVLANGIEALNPLVLPFNIPAPPPPLPVMEGQINILGTEHVAEAPAPAPAPEPEPENPAENPPAPGDVTG